MNISCFVVLFSQACLLYDLFKQYMNWIKTSILVAICYQSHRVWEPISEVWAGFVALVCRQLQNCFPTESVSLRSNGDGNTKSPESTTLLRADQMTFFRHGDAICLKN